MLFFLSFPLISLPTSGGDSVGANILAQAAAAAVQGMFAAAALRAHRRWLRLMAVVPYNVKRPKGLAEEAARQEEGEREKLLGDG